MLSYHTKTKTPYILLCFLALQIRIWHSSKMLHKRSYENCRLLDTYFFYINQNLILKNSLQTNFIFIWFLDLRSMDFQRKTTRGPELSVNDIDKGFQWQEKDDHRIINDISSRISRSMEIQCGNYIKSAWNINVFSHD